VSVPAIGLGRGVVDAAAGHGMDRGLRRVAGRQHAAFQGHPSYRVDVTGTWHGSFSNMCEGLSLVIDKGIHSITLPEYPWLPDAVIETGTGPAGAPLPNGEANRPRGQVHGRVPEDPPRRRAWLPEPHDRPARSEERAEGRVLRHREANPNAIDEDWRVSRLLPAPPGSQRSGRRRIPSSPCPFPTWDCRGSGSRLTRSRRDGAAGTSREAVRPRRRVPAPARRGDPGRIVDVREARMDGAGGGT